MENLKQLLAQVSNIVDIDNQIQEEKRKRGEKFNVFNVLGLWSDEVRLHSAFLAELLNPKGNHGLEDAFLKAFIKIVKLDNFDFDTENCDVEVEEFIGKVEDEKGGRIDILLTSNGQAIIIENKIYAGDGYKQLIRYNNYGKNYHENAFKILYLTLDGSEASEQSVGKKEEVDYLCISYRDSIKNWLERCIEISVSQPLIRETLQQYLTLVKQLTNQNMENNNEKQLLDLMASNVEASFQISENVDELKKQIIATKFSSQIRDEAKKIGYHLENEINDLSGIYASFGFRKATWKYFRVYFEFEKKNYGNLIFGVLNQMNITNVPKESVELLRKLKGRKNDNWHNFSELNKFSNWDSSVFSSLAKGNDELIIYIIDKLKEWDRLTQDIEM